MEKAVTESKSTDLSLTWDEYCALIRKARFQYEREQFLKLIAKAEFEEVEDEEPQPLTQKVS
jgi:hypothetical protein